MGRPSLHDAEMLLDASLPIAADSPQRLTVAEVARLSGAPSGSVYHRFSRRADLLGALWNRTVFRFQAGFIEAIDDRDPLRARVMAARHVITWSRENPIEARSLLHGVEAFDPADWPAAASQEADRHAQELARALDELAVRTPGGRARNLELLVFVTVDAPYAIVRRHLRDGATIGAGAEELVERCARSLGGSVEGVEPTPG
jgi:AcrR family transcriptional regulator